MLKTTSLLLAACTAVLLLCESCASTPPANPNVSAAAVMNPAPAQQAATQAAIAKASATGVPLDRVVAVVNNGVILQSELAGRVALVKRQLQTQGTALPAENVLRKQVLDQMVMTRLELQEATAKGITVSDDTVNQAIQRIAARNNISLSELPAKLQLQGIQYRDFRRNLRNELIIHDLEQQMVRQQMHITPREVQAQIASDAAGGEANARYHIAEILIATPANPTPQQVATTRKTAQGIYEKLKHGADFAAMAVEYSQDQQALKGGDLGWRKGSELPTIFTSVIRHMKPGDISEPLSSTSGFHILKLIAVKQASNRVMVTQTHARHILIETNALTTDAQAKAKLEALRKEILAGADFAKLAKKYSQDPGSMTKGGDLGWIDPGAMVPAFQAQMDKLQVGQISQPFKTQFGWHIVQVLGRRQVDQTRQFIQNKAYEALYTRKSDEIIQNWMSAIRDSAYIKYYLGS